MISVFTRMTLDKVRNSCLVFWNIPLRCQIPLKRYETCLKCVLPLHLFVSSGWGPPWGCIISVMGAVFPCQPLWGLQPVLQTFPRLSGGPCLVSLKRICCKSQHVLTHLWHVPVHLQEVEWQNKPQTHLPGYCCSIFPLLKEQKCNRTVSSGNWRLKVDLLPRKPFRVFHSYFFYLYPLYKCDVPFTPCFQIWL